MGNERSYEEDARIDENADLIKEWQTQAERMMYWSLKHSKAITNTNRIREKLRIIKGEVKRDIDRERAKVDFDIRRYPEDYGLPKNPTEASIANAINRDGDFLKFCDDAEKRVNDVSNELIDAIEEENVFESAVKAMSHKKRALENLQSLWEKNYYGEPDARTARANQSDTFRKNMREEFRRRHNNG